MKVTNRLTHIATKVNFETAKTEDQLKAAFEAKGIAGFLQCSTSKSVRRSMSSSSRLMTCWRFAKASGVAAVTYDVTYFPHADQGEVERQLKQLGHDLEISAEVIRDVCATEIQEYLDLDAKRDVAAPVHSIVECYVNGTAFAWYGLNDYPRLKGVVLQKLARGGQKAKHDFIMRASRAQVDLMDEDDIPTDVVLR